MNNFFNINNFKDQGLDEDFSDEENISEEENELKESNDINLIKNIDNKENKGNMVYNKDKNFNSKNDNNIQVDNSNNITNNTNEREKESFEKKENEIENKDKQKEEEKIDKEEQNEIKVSNNNENKTNEDIHYAIEDKEDVSEFDLIKNPAIKFPFELDDFQKRSIIRLEQNKNVLVCAHTSSGKTVVAEYGIALGKKHSKRVVYTSPIKALSNQKYREFKKRFDDVGILTGDVNINPDAQCLIMTTEILQNCLYKNSELLSQLECIIFDEIHYINDNERGHVWEEILILLHPEINLIMLSATIPNYMEFANWVGSIKKTTVYVEITLKRVVPLKHQIYIDSQNIFEVKNIEGKVYDYRVREAMKHLKEVNEGGIGNQFNNRKANEQQMKNSIKYFVDQKEKYYKKKYLDSLKNNDRDKIRITKMHHKLVEIVEYLQKINYAQQLFLFLVLKELLNILEC